MNNFQSANNRINQLANVKPTNKKNTMKTTTINDLTAGQNFRFVNSDVTYAFSMYNCGMACWCDKGADVTKDEFELLDLGFDTYIERMSGETKVIICD